MYKWIMLILFSCSATWATEYRLPYSGVWFVMQGGDTQYVNHHMALQVQPQWYGIDFVKVNNLQERRINKGDGSKLKHYYGFAAKVLSPTHGEIISLMDGFPDNPIGKTDRRNPAGNYVCIKTPDNKYIVIGHLKNKSLVVKVGDKVKTGDLLGLCGNSGNTTLPHIHMHIQDRPVLFTGTGQKIAFENINVVLSGKKFIGVSWPLIRGLFVWNNSSSAKLKNGVYLILRQGAKKNEVSVGSDKERKIVYNYKFLADKPDRPRRFLIVPSTPAVPLILTGKPQGSKNEEGRTILRLQLAQEYSKTLEEFTRDHLGKEIAIIIGGEVISTHKIRGIITGGKVKITRCTDNACEYILLKLQGS